MTPSPIAAVRTWLQTCPYIDDALGEFGTLGIHFLHAEPIQFSIEQSPGVPVVGRYFSGTDRVRNFLILSRLNFNESEALQLANSGLIEAVTDWIERQNDLCNFPDLGADYPVRRVEVTSSSYLQALDETTCKFAFQIAIYYYQPKGAASV